MDYSKMTNTKDMESTNTRMAMSMTDSGCKVSDKEREYSQKLREDRFRKANGKMTN